MNEVRWNLNYFVIHLAEVWSVLWNSNKFDLHGDIQMKFDLYGEIQMYYNSSDDQWAYYYTGFGCTFRGRDVANSENPGGDL